MCTLHHPSGISRRGFGSLAVASAGLSFLPFRAWAAGHAEAMCFLCIQYGLVNDSVAFFNHTVPDRKYDLTALAGASLSGVLTTFPDAVPGFWKQIELAKSLHSISKVHILDHMNCGAYWAQFNDGRPMQPPAERTAHRETMAKVRQAFVNRFSNSMQLDFFLMETTVNNRGDVLPGPINPVNV